MCGGLAVVILTLPLPGRCSGPASSSPTTGGSMFIGSGAGRRLDSRVLYPDSSGVRLRLWAGCAELLRAAQLRGGAAGTLGVSPVAATELTIAWVRAGGFGGVWFDDRFGGCGRRLQLWRTPTSRITGGAYVRGAFRSILHSSGCRSSSGRSQPPFARRCAPAAWPDWRGRPRVTHNLTALSWFSRGALPVALGLWKTVAAAGWVTVSLLLAVLLSARSGCVPG